MKQRLDSTIDIETLAIPETSGYDIVIPNYAIVRVPDTPETYELEWMYVQMPIQPQLDKGLAVSASCMSFWFDQCAEFQPRALDEMKKSFKGTVPTIQRSCWNGIELPCDDPSLAVSQFINGDDNLYDGKIWGNGCNFDCSILQANHLKMFNNAKMWHYAAPQNARSLKDLLSDDERDEMDRIVKDYLGRFETTTRVMHGMANLELHHPLYDAAREALQVSYCRNQKKG